ncbi:MAG TPA: thioredoxin [Actinobacteria bacterium]|jgi:thioredoxin 1|nr:thioredoxin [Actinomycetota bacterium]HCP62667.1 thioredoxin [Actinomycetota bacterium]
MSENITEVTDSDFDSEVLRSDRPVLVDFWAEWCVPCHMVSPVVEEIAREHSDRLKAAKLNVDDNPDTARQYGVMSIPTLIVFKDGQEKARVIGARGKEAILREIEPHFAA